MLFISIDSLGGVEDLIKYYSGDLSWSLLKFCSFLGWIKKFLSRYILGFKEKFSVDPENQRILIMEPSLDKAMLGMTLEEDEEPYTIPDRPEFYSTERNILSLVGRLLNPHCQGMKDLILDMPRKWQLYDRVRGVTLSKDRFQFIFKYEHDLIDILNRGVHTSNQWSLAMERWVERPPPDFLQFIEVWVQMRNIPVNHYTKAALTDLAEFAGQVIEVAFDPNKPQTNDYIRAKVKFDVSKPLRRFKTVNVPGGEVVKILYDYERLQKRCYTAKD